MEDLIQYLTPAFKQLVRYFIFAGLPFLIFYRLFTEHLLHHKIQSKWAQSKDFRREIGHSVQTSFVIGTVVALVFFTPLKEYTSVYLVKESYSLWWIPISIVLALIVHDSCFYWMHRLMHHPKLYRMIHLTHHKSVNPSPWTSYSFHFFEAITEALIAPIIMLLIPMHPIALIMFGMSSLFINVYGHLGFEISPRWFRKSIFFEFVNTSVHHNLHHEKFHGNYGLYFRIWDRIMGTEHPDYVKEYDRIQEQRFSRANLNV